MTATPIADYAVLSDCHSAALVSRAGSIDWLCAPRFDSPSVFGRLLGSRAGHWTIVPLDVQEIRREYRPDTLVLDTAFTTVTGRCVLTDAMAVGENPSGHMLGRNAPHAVVRVLRCLEGDVKAHVEFAPRPEYGLVAPLLVSDGDALRGRGEACAFTLAGSTQLYVADGTASAMVTLRAGSQLSFALVLADNSVPPEAPWSPGEIDGRLLTTVDAWRCWSQLHQNYEGPWRDLVHRSGIVLQGLTYQPTGAIVAAATTSLPEAVGGGRNWDYRYSWVRDASLTLDALWVAACPDEAHEFFHWMARATAVWPSFCRCGKLWVRGMPRRPGWRYLCGTGRRVPVRTDCCRRARGDPRSRDPADSDRAEPVASGRALACGRGPRGRPR